MSCKLEPGFNCSNITGDCSPICGDGLVKGIETCDDGNLNNLDGCSSSC